MPQQTTTRTARKARLTRERTVAQIEVIRLSREAQEKFVEMLLNPNEPGPALERAFERHRALVASE
jgi:uncharacterized protein (DUF1778 family)